MASEISLFSQKAFIDASKKYVCVRLGTYESKEHQDMVRSLLRGTFQNTAFVVYAPDGKTKLTRSGRAPHHAFGPNTIQGMLSMAKKYPARDAQGQAVLQDFHSFKQSLNVASADQRLLVFSIPSNTNPAKQHSTLRSVFNDKEISGRFHFDSASLNDAQWKEVIEGEKESSGTFIIQAGKFGQTGKVLAELPLGSSAAQIKKALLEATAIFAKAEKRKNYNLHVADGRKQGINFQNTMPPGEDRDGDGKIDPRPGRNFQGNRPGRFGR